MRKGRLLVGAIGLALVLAAGRASGQMTLPGPGEGDPAPEFALEAADGHVVKLSDYKGKEPVVLIFYRGFF